MAHKGKEHVLSICGAPEESLTVKERLDALIAAGQRDHRGRIRGQPEGQQRRRGGPAFEFLLNVHHRLKKLGIRDKFDLVFFAPMPQPGIRMGEKAVRAMDKMFRSLGIRSYTGKKITEFDDGAVTLEDGTRIEADLFMFIAAGDGHGVIKASDLPLNEAGFVAHQRRTCEVQGHPWLYAIGDVAALEGPDWKAKQGHIAEVMARTAADDIARKISGRGEAGQLRGRRLHPLRDGHGERRRASSTGTTSGRCSSRCPSSGTGSSGAGDATTSCASSGRCRASRGCEPGCSAARKAALFIPGMCTAAKGGAQAPAGGLRPGHVLGARF